jgi:hypothetical protein
MSKEKILIKLGTQIDTLRAHINRLKRAGYDVHSLDVEMLRKKTIEFYELVFELEGLYDSVNLAEKAPAVEPITKVEPSINTKDKHNQLIKQPEPEAEIVKEEPKANIVIKEKPKLEQVVEETISKPIVSAPPTDKNPDIQIEKPVAVVTSEEKTETEPVITPTVNEDPVLVPQETLNQTTYDLFSGNSDGAVAEKYHLSDEQSIAEKMQKSNITNIREAIGINEKFLFINELFNGDLGRYNKILDDINELPTKKGVDTYLMELKIQFQWADDNDAYIKFREIIDRKA